MKPLVDAKEKGNVVESLGTDIVDGDEVQRLKVTLKNGDIVYCALEQARRQPVHGVAAVLFRQPHRRSEKPR